MGKWTKDELDGIESVPNFILAAALPDGSTPKSVRIWAVRAGDDIYVRSYNGTGGKWYAPALESGMGRISVGGVTKDVTFTPVRNEQTNADVDDAYRKKYPGQSATDLMVGEPVRHNTLLVTPRQ